MSKNPFYRRATRAASMSLGRMGRMTTSTHPKYDADFHTCPKCAYPIVTKKEDKTVKCPQCGYEFAKDVKLKYYCRQCNVYSTHKHDHTDDSVESLERPRHDY